MAARPVFGSTITAGAYLDTVIVWAIDADFRSMARTTSGYLPAARSGGIWKLIWFAEVKVNGTGWLLSVTQAPPMIFGSGSDEVVSAEARLFPKIDTMLLGASVVWALAMLTRPLVLICG